ncbi:Uncharacterised protein [Edwardsiella tarda]|nr:Uncharacterised protein [Edwardsiella tarda]
MSQIELFLPAVRRGISGPLAMMMREALLRAAIRFCRESLISRETLTFGSLPVGGDRRFDPRRAGADHEPSLVRHRLH